MKKNRSLRERLALSLMKKIQVMDGVSGEKEEETMKGLWGGGSKICQLGGGIHSVEIDH